MIDREAKTKKKEQEKIPAKKDNIKKEILYKMVVESIMKTPRFSIE